MREKQPIGKLRQQAGLTIDRVAELFGVDRTTIIRWEKGAPHIPLKRLDDAERIFGAPRRELRPDIFEGV